MIYKTILVISFILLLWNSLVIAATVSNHCTNNKLDNNSDLYKLVPTTGYQIIITVIIILMIIFGGN